MRLDLSVEDWLRLAESGARPGATIRLAGGSMAPFIRRGKDQVVIRRPIGPVRPGDIILLRARRRAGEYMLHRVYWARAGMVRTMGDNCLRPDDWVEQSDVLAVAEAVVRDGRAIDLRSPMWRMLWRVWALFLPVRAPILRFCRAMLRHEQTSEG